MAAVNMYITQLESSFWHKMENWSAIAPKAAPFLAVPIALETVVKISLACPLRAIENTIRIFISMKEYFTANDSKIKQAKSRDMQWYSFHAIKNALATPLAPIAGLIQAMILAQQFYQSPLTYAKLTASEKDLKLFIHNNSLSGEAQHFAEGAWRRFMAMVLSPTITRQDLIKLQFVGHPAIAKQITQQIADKQAVLARFSPIHSEWAQKCVTEASSPLEAQQRTNKLKRAWDAFINQLSFAKPSEIASLEFNFSL